MMSILDCLYFQYVTLRYIIIIMVKRKLNVQYISYFWIIWENVEVSWGFLARKHISLN